MLSNRNIGLLSEEQQEKLRNTCVAVCGLGGIGGPVAEMLCRLGIGKFRLLDNGTYELSNLNRQIYAFTDTDSALKTDITEQFLTRINPEVQIEKYIGINDTNSEQFLRNADVVVLGIDSVIPCLIISRMARILEIPIVEGWAVMAGNVRVFTNQTPTLEEVYKMPTIGRNIDDISHEEEKQLLLHTLRIVQEQIKGLSELYPETAMQRMEEKNEGTTLAPVVWLTCSLMAIETMKLILNWGKIALAPEFATYNPIDHRIM